MSGTKPTFQSVNATAHKLGLPVAWLRREAQAGRVPSIRAGKRLLLDPEAVARMLAERAEQQAQGREASV